MHIQAISCTLSQTDVVRIALQLKEFLHEEIDYTIKATIDQYKDEIVKLTKENEKLRDDIDALEQYGRRDFKMRINDIQDGGRTETAEQTTLVSELIQSIDGDLQADDIIRSHRIGPAPDDPNTSRPRRDR